MLNFGVFLPEFSLTLKKKVLGSENGVFFPGTKQSAFKPIVKLFAYGNVFELWDSSLSGLKINAASQWIVVDDVRTPILAEPQVVGASHEARELVPVGNRIMEWGQRPQDILDCTNSSLFTRFFTSDVNSNANREVPKATNDGSEVEWGAATFTLVRPILESVA